MAAVTWGTPTEISFDAILEGILQDEWAISDQIAVPACHDLIIGGFVEFLAAPTADETVELYITTPYDPTSATTAGDTIGAAIDGGTNVTENAAEITEGTAFTQENLILANVITLQAVTTPQHSQPFSLSSLVGALPKYFQLVLHNNCATADLDTTDGGDFWYYSVTYGNA